MTVVNSTISPVFVMSWPPVCPHLPVLGGTSGVPTIYTVLATNEPEAAGLIANLAFELNDGGASTLVRQELARNLEILKGHLATSKARKRTETSCRPSTRSASQAHDSGPARKARTVVYDQAMRFHRCALFTAGLLVSCASAPTPAPQSSLVPPPKLPTQAETASPAIGFTQALDTVYRAIATGDMTSADKQLAAAEQAVGDDPHRAHLVARARATRFAAVSDFENAAVAFVAVMPTLARHLELADEFWAHNTMMMIREAQGDPAAALAENDQATLSAERGTWDPEGRKALALQKDRWHRAYLTRMLAESRTGSVKQALVEYAEAALDDYRVTGFPESIAVLEAYFAALDGKRDAALVAAKRVDPAKDDDVEDLYLVVLGLEAGGDHGAAEAVRHLMRKSQGVHIARFIMLRWLDLDAKAPAPGMFTPWHSRR